MREIKNIHLIDFLSENIRNFASQMCSLDTFKIDLKELKEDGKTFSFHLDDSYFKAIDAPDVMHGELDVEVNVQKVADMFRFDIHTDGVVRIPCDICLEDMDQPIDADNHLVAKFGLEYNDDDEVIIVPEEEGILDMSWFIYEFIVLNIPIKHVHAPGKCNPAMIQMLHEHNAARSSEEEEEQTTDPRWDALKKLKDSL